jgi:hypothetical protein
MDVTKNHVESGLRELGFFAIQESIEDLKVLAETMAKNASTSTAPRFESFPSYIPVESSPVYSKPVIAVDIGGTSTKAGIRVSNGASVSWKMLFEHPNDQFKPVTGDKFSDFAKMLAEEMAEKLSSLNIELADVAAAGFVWSNAMKNSLTPEGSITGCIEDRKHYTKGEWFINDLTDGSNIGNMLADAFKAAKFNLLRYLIANDTTLAMKAIPGAAAGMVASTGLNGTLVAAVGGADGKEPVICNGEIGGRFFIPENYLSKADYKDQGERAATVEAITAGRFLPQLFVSYIEALANETLPSLQPLVKELHKLGTTRWATAFRAKDLNALCNDKGNFSGRLENPALYTSEVVDQLSELAKHLVDRSTLCAALTAYATVVTQFDGGTKKLTVAMDSRLAREMPGYLTSMQKHLNSMAPAGVSITVTLAEPLQIAEGSVSVPMLGIANALDSLLAE